MTRLLLFALIGYAVYLFMKGRASKSLPAGQPAADSSEETLQDPICGVYVSKNDALVGTVAGERHYFCSMACLERYRTQLADQAAAAPSSPNPPGGAA